MKTEKKLLFFRLKYQALEIAYPASIVSDREAKLDKLLRSAAKNLLARNPSADEQTFRDLEQKLKNEVIPLVLKDDFSPFGPSAQADCTYWPFCF
jgi:hypothetical protein